MGLAAADAPPRRRLTPAVRRDQILNVVARAVQREGLSAVTMEGLAQEAGVSKGLLYTYFPNRDALLAALLQREQADLRERGMAEALTAHDFRELIHQTTRLYLQQCRDRGAMIAALTADPSVARLMEAQTRADGDRTVRYFVRATRREYGLPLPTAILAVQLLMAVTGRAGAQVAEGVLGLDEAEDMVVRLILGGLSALKSEPEPREGPPARPA